MTNQFGNRKRGQVFARTGGKCAYCGRQFDPFSAWVVEHCNPKELGGGNELDNLVPACQSCNTIKGQRGINDFRFKIMQQLLDTAERLQKLLARPYPLVYLEGMHSRNKGIPDPNDWQCHVEPTDTEKQVNQMLQDKCDELVGLLNFTVARFYLDTNPLIVQGDEDAVHDHD